MTNKQLLAAACAGIQGAQAAIITSLPSPDAGPRAAAQAIPLLQVAAGFYQQFLNNVDPTSPATNYIKAGRLRDACHDRSVELGITAAVPWPIVYAPLGAISKAIEGMIREGEDLVNQYQYQRTTRKKKSVKTDIAVKTNSMASIDPKLAKRVNTLLSKAIKGNNAKRSQSTKLTAELVKLLAA